MQTKIIICRFVILSIKYALIYLENLVFVAGFFLGISNSLLDFDGSEILTKNNDGMSIFYESNIVYFILFI